MRTYFYLASLAAIAAISFVGLVSAAAQSAADGGVGAGVMFMFMVTVAIFHATHSYTLVTASRDAERLIHKERRGARAGD